MTIQLQNLPQIMGIDIWYDVEEEQLKVKENITNKEINKVSMNQVTRSGRVYQPDKRKRSTKGIN